jgi:hypothetical protein
VQLDAALAQDVFEDTRRLARDVLEDERAQRQLSGSMRNPPRSCSGPFTRLPFRR